MKFKFTRRNRIFSVLSGIAILYIAMIVTFSFIHPSIPENFFISIGIKTSLTEALLFTWNNVWKTIELNYPGILRLFLLTTLFLSLYAWFVLSKGKNIIEVFLLFIVYIIPYPEAYWGKVLDKTTSKPLPFSTLRIIRRRDGSDKNEFIEETISDLYGRYRLNIEKEEGYQYYLQVAADSYKILDKNIGKGESEVISIYNDIFLEPLTQSNVSQFRKLYNNFKTHLNDKISYYLYLASLLSLLIGIRSVVQNETPIGNSIYLVQYIVAVIINSWRIYSLRTLSIGKVMLYQQRKVIPNLRFQIKKGSVVLDKSVSSKGGILNFNVSPGVYQLELLDRNYEFPNNENSSSNLIEVIVSEKGFLRNNIILKETNSASSQIPNLNMMNPFG